MSTLKRSRSVTDLACEEASEKVVEGEEGLTTPDKPPPKPSTPGAPPHPRSKEVREAREAERLAEFRTWRKDMENVLRLHLGEPYALPGTPEGNARGAFLVLGLFKYLPEGPHGFYRSPSDNAGGAGA